MAVDKNEVWLKGHTIKGENETYWRKDDYGNVISRKAYGNQNSDYGWQVDHINPAQVPDRDNIDNLRPLQWAENTQKSNTYPYKKVGNRLGKTEVPKKVTKKKTPTKVVKKTTVKKKKK